MAITIDVRQANNTIRTMSRQLSAEQIARATARAINHTSSKANTQAKRQIIGRYNLHKTQVQGKRLKLKKAFPKKLYGGIDASSRPIPLISFIGTHQTKRGVMVSVVKGQKRLLRGAFIQTTKKGRRAVFARGEHKDGSFEWRHKRLTKSGPDLPIQELSTVSMYSTGTAQPVQSAMQAVVSRDYQSRIIKELDNIIQGVTR